jgi:hypothetical protein
VRDVSAGSAEMVAGAGRARSIASLGLVLCTCFAVSSDLVNPVAPTAVGSSYYGAHQTLRYPQTRPGKNGEELSRDDWRTIHRSRDREVASAHAFESSSSSVSRSAQASPASVNRGGLRGAGVMPGCKKYAAEAMPTKGVQKVVLSASFLKSAGKDAESQQGAAGDGPELATEAWPSLPGPLDMYTRYVSPMGARHFSRSEGGGGAAAPGLGTDQAGAKVEKMLARLQLVTDAVRSRTQEKVMACRWEPALAARNLEAFWDRNCTFGSLRSPVQVDMSYHVHTHTHTHKHKHTHTHTPAYTRRNRRPGRI